MRLLPALLLVLTLAACSDDGPSTADATPGDSAAADGTPDASGDATPADTASPADTLPEAATDTGPAPDTGAPDTAGDAAPETDACTPDCLGKACGPDGCGATCGACTGGYLCHPSGACLAPLCEVGTTACSGDAITLCVDPLEAPEVQSTCVLGCTQAGGAPACGTSCTPGDGLACAFGVAKRCAAGGDAAFTVTCLGPCDAAGLDCMALGAAPRMLATGEGPADEVKRFAVAAAGPDRLLVAWSRALTPSVQAQLTDGDGNVLAGPITLEVGGPLEPTQLQVAAGPDGTMAVLALAPGEPGSPASAWLWWLGWEPPALTVHPMVVAEPFVLPSLATLPGRLTLVYLEPAEGGGERLARTVWTGPEAQPSFDVVDATVTERFDVRAVAAAPDLVHVYASAEGGARRTASTVSTPAGETTSLGGGDLFVADASGHGGLSAVLALAFLEADEVFRYRVAGDPADTGWIDVGSSAAVGWAALALHAGGVLVVTQTADGVLHSAPSTPGALGAKTPLWTPTEGALRSGFQLATPTGAGPRLVTLGRDAASEPIRLRIQIP